MRICGEDGIGLRLVLSACVVAVLAGLVWSARSVLAPSGPSSPEWVVKPVPTLPSEMVPFLLAEEQDSRIGAQFATQSSFAHPTEHGVNQACVSPRGVEQNETAMVAPDGSASGELPEWTYADQHHEKTEQTVAYGNRKEKERRPSSSLVADGQEVIRGRQPRFALHVESFRDAEVARKRAEYLRGSGLEAFLLPVTLPGKETWYRVLVGKFAERKEAEAARLRVEKEKGLKGIRVVSVQPGKP